MNKPRRPKLRIVIDTNIIVSALNFGGLPSEVLKLAIESKATNIISEYILRETERVLIDKFFWNETDAKITIKWLERLSALAKPKKKISAIGYDPDNRILECAVAGHADFIVSGDKKHLLKLGKFENITIIDPAKFLKTFKKHRH